MSRLSYFFWAIGPLNAVALGLFLPIFGFQVWSRLILCPCPGYMAPFYLENPFRLTLILGAWLLIPLIDSGVCHVLLQRRLADTLRYLLWRWVQCLPALFFLGLVLSGGLNVIYFAAGVLSLFTVFPGKSGRSLINSPGISGERALSSVPQLIPVLVYMGTLFCLSMSFVRGGTCDCGKISAIKANMHTLQTALETYAVAKGCYPPSIELPEKQLQRWPGWRVFTNPITGRNEAHAVYRDYGPAANGHLPILESECGTRWLGIPVYTCQPDTERAGQVLYQAKSPTSYVLYGVNGYGFLLAEKGKPYVLDGPPP